MSIINNTTKLQELKTIVESLPVAENLTPELAEQDNLIAQIAEALEGKTLPDGGGSNIDTCMVQITNDRALSTATFYYTDATTMTAETITTKDGNLIVPKNTIIAIEDWPSTSRYSDCIQIFYHMRYAAFWIIDNCTFIIEG